MQDPDRFTALPPTPSSLRVLGWLAYAAVLSVGTFLLFYRLDCPSISTKDEFLHAFVTQEMWQTGSWFTPTIDGKPYYNKPPLKMWMTFLPLAAFGEQGTWIYRLPDAVAGLGVVSLVFFFCVRAFGSVLAGGVAGIAILGCQSLLFAHGFRRANQDAMLLFFLTAALMLSLEVLKTLERDATGSETALPRARKLALGAGALIGLGALTKSVGAFIAFPIVGSAFAILAFRKTIRFRLSPCVAALIPALLLPALYYVPHMLHSRTALKVMLFEEVADRMSQGYHRQADTWFYLKQIFHYEDTLPPELFVAGTLLALWLWHRKRSTTSLFLLFWVLVPIAFYTAVPSRTRWYIAPALPAAAILAGQFVAELVRLRAGKLIRAAVLSLSMLAVARVAQFATKSAYAVINSPEPIPLALALEDVAAFELTHDGVRVFEANRINWQKHERFYTRMVHKERGKTKVSSVLVKKASTQRAFVVLSGKDSNALTRLGHFESYTIIPPYSIRNEPVVILAFDPEFTSPLFRQSSESLRASDPSPMGCFDSSGVSVALAGDSVHSQLGAVISVVLSQDGAKLSGEKTSRLEARLDGRPLQQVPPIGEASARVAFESLPEHWKNERPILEITRLDGDSSGSQRLCIEHIEVALRDAAM